MTRSATRQMKLPFVKPVAKRRRGGPTSASARGAATERRARALAGFLPHVARAPHKAAHPVHVTMRRVVTGPSFRSQRVAGAIFGVIHRAKRNGVRVLHFSVQDNHLHLMVEGRDSADLSNQMRTLFSRIAFAVNAVARRHGKLFRDRHHRHELTKPSEVRNALVYILFNDRKHAAQAGAVRSKATQALSSRSTAKAPRVTQRPTLDPYSSAWWFHDWSPDDHPPSGLLRDRAEAPTSKPGTWLARFGWHRGDEARLLRFSELPRTAS